jgi:heat shock protein HslJ
MRLFYIILIISLFSCRTTKNSKDIKNVNVLQESYKIELIDGINFSETPPTLKFNFSENKIYGFAICNHYSADFLKEKNQIKFTSISATVMYCDDIKSEKIFFRNLNRVTQYKIENEKLFLLDDNDKIIIILK